MLVGDGDIEHSLAHRDRGWVHGDEGLGYLDKSGIAELTFKDRHKHSGDRV